jgi:IS30 family transposase
MKYKQLTRDERYHIYRLRKVGWSLKSIATELKRSPSTISRELRRNSSVNGYDPEAADRLAKLKGKYHQSSRISAETWQQIREKIIEDWSPEQISGWLSRKGLTPVSTEWIYQFILRNKMHGGCLHQHLRCKKKRKKRYGAVDRRGTIKDRVCISKRPEIVERRERIGDWEIDTVLGGQKRAQVLVTAIERVSRFSVIAIAKDRCASAVKAALVEALRPYKDVVHTLTFDNGKEFAYHKEVTQELSSMSYFARPYHSWERGANENMNGLIRQYAPKGSDFNGLTDEKVRFIMDRLNNRPRKCLEFKTPSEVLHSVYQHVALAS